MAYAFWFCSECSDSLLISSSTKISFISVHSLNTKYFTKDFIDVITNLPILTQHCSQRNENYMIQVSQAAWAVMQLFPNFNCRNFCTSNGKMWSQNMMLIV